VISLDGLLVRLQALTPAGVTFWRGLLTGLAFTVVLIVSGRSNRAHKREPWWPVCAFAVLMVFGTVTWVFSLTHTTIAHTLVIVSSAPIVTGLLGYALLRERLPLRTWLAGAAALVGVVIVVSGSLATNSFQGDVWAVGNTFVLAVMLILLRRHPDLNRALALAVSSFATALVVLPWGAQMPDLRSLAAASVDGLVVVPAGLLMITLAPRFLPAAEVGLLLLLETVLGPLWVLMLLGEALSVQAVVSGAIILGAITVHSMLELRSQQAVTAQPAGP